MWGGSFITQAEPTNFHKFYTRKILTPTESISDWREVSEAEKTALEESDAKWTTPSEEFIAMCKAVDPNVEWNAATGYFEYNGLKDITTLQMRDIYRYTSGPLQYDLTGKLSGLQFRTNIPLKSNVIPLNIGDLFCDNAILEICVMPQTSLEGFQVGAFNSAWRSCRALREIKPDILINGGRSRWDAGTFRACYALETIHLKRLSGSLTLNDSQKLSLDSIAYMVQYATNTTPITITLHPDAYARVTDEIFTAAAEKQITIASA